MKMYRKIALFYEQQKKNGSNDVLLFVFTIY